MEGIHLGIRKMGATIDDLRVTPGSGIEVRRGRGRGVRERGERDGHLPYKFIWKLYRDLDLPRGAEWMIRGAYTPSFRVQTAPFGRCWEVFPTFSG